MAGARAPGPLGVGDEGSTASAEHGPGRGHSPRGPTGIGPTHHEGLVGGRRGRGKPPNLADGLSFAVAGQTYRLRRAAGAGAPDEQLLGLAEGREVLRRAVDWHPELGELRHLIELDRSLVVVRLKSLTLGASASPTAQAPAPPSSPPPKPAKVVKEGWIEIEVTDELGQPRTGDAYRLQLPDGRVLEGTVGPGGMVSVHGIDPGSAKLTLTSLDGRAWS